MIAVDTSVLVDFFRGRKTVAVEALATLDASGARLFIPSVCCQEVLQSARDEREWKLLSDYLSSQLVLHPESQDTHVAAARLYFECRRKGLIVRSTIDCLVAQLAIEADAELLHDDKDFERLARISSLLILDVSGHAL